MHEPTKLHILDLGQIYKLSTPSHPKLIRLDGRVIHGQVMLAPVYDPTLLRCWKNDREGELNKAKRKCSKKDRSRESKVANAVKAAKSSQKRIAIIVHDVYYYERRGEEGVAE